MRKNSFMRMLIIPLFGIVLAAGYSAAPAVAGESSANSPSNSMSVMREPGTPLSPQKLKRVLRKVGFKGTSRKIAWAIALRESRGIPDIVSPLNSNGTRDNGLFQINDVHRSQHSFDDILTPLGNAKIAYVLSQGGTDFSAWGIGDQGWAGDLKKNQPEFWTFLQEELDYWMAQYP